MMNAVWYESGEDYTPCAEVRKTVFVAEQGYTLAEEFDDYDSVCPHLVLFDGDTPVATGRLVLLSDGTAKLGRIAVLKAYRGQHLGAQIVQELLKRAKAEGAVRAYVSAQSYAVPFYNKFGLREYGDEYLDGRIPHRDMDMKLQRSF